MANYTKIQIENFALVTKNSLEVRRLGALLRREIHEFDSIEDFYTHLDKTMAPVEFCGSTITPSKMAKMTSNDSISTVNSDHKAWLDTINKSELTEFKDIESQFQICRTNLNDYLNIFEKDKVFEVSKIEQAVK